MNRGSEWHKWDLHFHTPSSYDYEDGSVTNDDIVNGLLANDVAAVAITDHHVIDVERISELQRIAAGRITILPGIEFLSDARGKELIDKYLTAKYNVCGILCRKEEYMI